MTLLLRATIREVGMGGDIESIAALETCREFELGETGLRRIGATSLMYPKAAPWQRAVASR